MKFYAIKKGLNPGIYTTWNEAQTQVSGFKGAEYKSFKTESEALTYLSDSKTKLSETEPTNIQSETSSEVFAYVDGSFNPETNKVGSAVIFRSGTKNTEPKELKFTNDNTDLDDMRNVGGEIIASTSAIHYAIQQGFKSITIYYDYLGIEKWATHEWKANNNSTQTYAKMIDQFRSLIEIKFTKVKAHTGVELNELADKTAKSAVGIF